MGFGGGKILPEVLEIALFAFFSLFASNGMHIAYNY